MFFQRKLTNGQHKYVKMLKTSLMVREMQKKKKDTSYTNMSRLLVWLLSKRQKTASVSKAVEQREPLGTVDGSKNGTALRKKKWRFLKS